ncbi:MAG: GNAT family N-acetyltransferase [Firmicutes bacterium]|nr:GNAT family N-acetyltransferase [Bacillota bacterium]
MKKNKSKFSVRCAEFRDAAQIFALIRMYPEELLQRSIGDIVQNIDRFLLCEIEGTVAGVVSWQILPEIGIPTKPSVEIKSLAVMEKYRGIGVGKALVLKAMEHIKPLNPRQIIALTFTPAFFASLGFKETPKSELMHKIYAGCINCIKYDSPFTCPEQAMSFDLDGQS